MTCLNYHLSYDLLLLRTSTLDVFLKLRLSCAHYQQRAHCFQNDQFSNQQEAYTHNFHWQRTAQEYSEKIERTHI